MTILQTNKNFFTTTQKTLFFWAFFWNFPFPCFSCFVFFFFQHEKDKNKKCTFFFENPFFDTLTNCQKIIFAPLHTICVFLRYPKNTIKLGKKAKKKLGPGFDATLDQVLTQKTPNLGPGFDSTAYIYIWKVYVLWTGGVDTTSNQRNKDVVIEMGAVSQYFSKVLWSGVNLTLSMLTRKPTPMTRGWHKWKMESTLLCLYQWLI